MKKTDYQTEKYCTCEKHFYESHICPFKEDIAGDTESLCNCCIYCKNQCCMNI